MEVKFSFYKQSGSNDEQFLLQALHFFIESSFCPDKYNYFEPINISFTKAEIPIIIDNIINKSPGSASVLFRRKNKLPFYVEININSRNLNEITGVITLKKDEQKFIDIIVENFSAMFLSLNLEYGYIALMDEIEERNEYEKSEVYPSGYIDTGMVRGGVYLDDGFPGLYWLNFFGKVSNNYFTNENLKSCPAYRISELDNNIVMIQLYENPTDFHISHIHNEAIKYLGEKSFFDNKHPERKLDSAGVIVKYESTEKIHYVDE